MTRTVAYSVLAHTPTELDAMIKRYEDGGCIQFMGIDVMEDTLTRLKAAIVKRERKDKQKEKDEKKSAKRGAEDDAASSTEHGASGRGAAATKKPKARV